MSNIISSETHHVPIASYLNNIVKRIVETAAWLNVVLAILILVTVILRYGFHRNELLLGWPLVPMEGLQWHLYSVPFMFGLSYAITNDSHIRIDIVNKNLPQKLQNFFEIFGILFLLLPCVLILFDFGFDYAVYSYSHNESSQSTMGLPHRWIVKTVIPISMLLMIIAAVARLIEKTVFFMFTGKEEWFVPSGVSIIRKMFTPKVKDKT